jgi:Transglutaminase-like superfamily
MRSTRTLRLRAFCELIRYDIVAALAGFRGVRSRLPKADASRVADDGLDVAISRAVDWAAAFYWKRVLCLQRSVAATRLLRAYGVKAELVIGCRLAPFAGHAWVEVGGRVLNGPAAYPRHLQILDRA